MTAARHRTRIIWLWLSLVVVLGHAVMPFGTPLAGRGSAFSASTSDVSLIPSRRSQAGNDKALGLSPANPGADGNATFDSPMQIVSVPAGPLPPSVTGRVPAPASAGPVLLAGVDAAHRPRGPPLI